MWTRKLPGKEAHLLYELGTTYQPPHTNGQAPDKGGRSKRADCPWLCGYGRQRPDKKAEATLDVETRTLQNEDSVHQHVKGFYDLSVLKRKKRHFGGQLGNTE